MRNRDRPIWWSKKKSMPKPLRRFIVGFLISFGIMATGIILESDGLFLFGMWMCLLWLLILDLFGAK